MFVVSFSSTPLFISWSSCIDHVYPSDLQRITFVLTEILMDETSASHDNYRGHIQLIRVGSANMCPATSLVPLSEYCGSRKDRASLGGSRGGK
jgi:hypothetical protein